MTEQLVNIAIELDSRERGNNLVLAQYAGATWNRLCFWGKKYLNKLTNYESLAYADAVHAQIMQDIWEIDKGREQIISYTHLLAPKEAIDHLFQLGWDVDSNDSTKWFFSHPKKNYRLMLTANIETFELTLQRCD